MDNPNRTWAEVDIDNLIHNYNQFVSITKTSGSKIMTVVKANAYGHGAVAISKVLESIDVCYLAVASLDEALEIRKSGVKSPILVLSYISLSRSEEIIKNDITATVFQIKQARELNNWARSLNKKLKIHIKIDTGMTRIGFNFEDATHSILEILKCEYLELEGMFTHFSSADEFEEKYTNIQFEKYMKIVEELKSHEINIPIKHVCNSAGSISYPKMHLDMIRIGISLYGCYPSEEVDKNKIHLKPVMSLKTEVIRLNEVERGVSVGYGRKFITDRKSKLATIPIGYADGFSRSLSGKIKVLIKDELVPVVGRICMDQCIIDVTDIEGEVKIGDGVVIFGTQNNKTISTEFISQLIGTVNYEILCMVSRRVPRYYIKDGKIYDVQNYLI